MELEAGAYRIGGVSINELTKAYGTPLYVYDAAKIREQFKSLTEAFKHTNHRILYACKANANLNILSWLRQQGAGLDTVSIQEVYLGLEAGFEPGQILFTPNCVSFQEIEAGIEAGVHLNIDNISILEQFGHAYGSQYPVCLRINPHLIGGGHHQIQTGHIDSKFGISIHQLRHVLRVVRANNIRVEGVHMHTGSDILDTNVFLNALEVLLETAREFEDLKYIDFGSGFKVAYKEDDVITDIDELGQEVSRRFNEFCQSYGRDLELWFEPGKFLVSEAGYFLSKVNVIKQTVANVFAGLDSGLNHLIRPMFYDSYHHIINATHPHGKNRVYTVVGNICETDTFGVDRKLTEVREGDILAFFNAGAYGFSMASNFNARYRPAEVMTLEGTPYLIRQREDFQDLLAKQVVQDTFQPAPANNLAATEAAPKT